MSPQPNAISPCGPPAHGGPWPTLTWGLLPWWSDSRRCRPPCVSSTPRGATSGPWWRRWPPPDCRSRGSILARPVTLPKRPDKWPRRMPLTRGPWPLLPRPCGRPPGLCLRPKPPHSALSWHGGGHGWRCGRPHSTAWGMPPHGCRQTSKRLSPARYPAGGAGRRPGHDAADASGMAGARGVAPPRPRHWPGLYTHAAARPASVGHVEPPAPSRLGRGGSVAPGSWHAPGPPDDLGGRVPVRATLAMSTRVAGRYQSVLKVFYERLQAAGQAAKVALTACMRQLLTILNAMVKHH